MRLSKKVTCLQRMANLVALNLHSRILFKERDSAGNSVNIVQEGVIYAICQSYQTSLEEVCRVKMEINKPRYFVAKMASIKDLKTSSETSQWACKDRVNPPHPADILRGAVRSGPVIIVFSVNNCHGWHGYAEMTSAPSELTHEEEGTGTANGDENNRQKETKTVWRYFNIDWKIIYLREFGERCLPSSDTENLTDITGSPVNKCRNWQELPEETGSRLCQLMEVYYKDLCLKREEKLKKQLENVPEPFYKTQTQSSTEIWGEIVKQVEEELGKVILACPFGSQRYNLSVPDSDTDMFIVYQAKTSQVLGFHPPKQTVKNKESQTSDYTIHEIFRFAELLSSGDARCVETLFLHQSTVIQDSPEYQLLRTGRNKFLHRLTLEKYLRDAQGTHGTKLFRKWCNENKDKTVLPLKMCKLVYVIVRLLQNARDIVCGGDVTIYRDEGSCDREELMTIRRGNISVQTAWSVIQRLEDEISEKQDAVQEKSTVLDKFLEDWLLKLRYSDIDNDLMKKDLITS